MRNRLVGTYVLLLCMVLVALEVPFAIALSNRETERVVADRLADATRFASLAAPALRSGRLESLKDELRSYYALYGIATMLVDQDQRVLSVFGSPATDFDTTVRGALAGRQVSTPSTLWPWESQRLIVAVPVSDGGAVLGSVLLASPTGHARRSEVVSWLSLGIGGLLAVAACIATAYWLAGWVLRPVTRLDAAAHEIAAGDSAARVQPGLGPPELRRLSASFNEMADAVAESLERQRSFVAHASHQLRNPLTVLRLRIEDLGGRLSSSSARDDHALALAETDRFADVLDGLLALARAERGRLAVIEVDATAVTMNRAEAWRPLTERRKVELVTTAPSAPLPGRFVATALDQALDALIDNAIKFTPAGGRVEVTAAASEGGVAICVRDSGPGMTEEQCRLATERFWRAPDAQNVDGAGLGLSIVAVLIEASGGRFTLAPADGGGLEARIWGPGPTT
ncbi:HAMP domain-containing histidine kinase [Actinoplanes sp. KI2]|uniref:sensor histidine kinase n=1 Tax=Actinoplanes sp. KI2 TaxID=2983315 RepID=UPI0021D590D7|nr:HAMP domain-containing sensor histidine kinase [Actinoplanes sp. KI2]MCU7726219.1 HAMP domain-containing histidine kinase [Actinoplanes sp. KI2]